MKTHAQSTASSRRRPRTRRDEIYDYVCDYADEHGGPTPSIHEIALAFQRSYSTIYRHVQRLREENRLDYRDGKLIVPNARWLPPYSDSDYR